MTPFASRFLVHRVFVERLLTGWTRLCTPARMITSTKPFLWYPSVGPDLISALLFYLFIFFIKHLPAHRTYYTLCHQISRAWYQFAPVKYILYCFQSLDGHHGAITSVKFDEYHILTCSLDCYAMAWSAIGSHKKCLQAFRHPKYGKKSPYY